MSSVHPALWIFSGTQREDANNMRKGQEGIKEYK
jgi:hypothetical protein